MSKDLIKEYSLQNYAQMLDTLRELCAIPAPSHFEGKRAEYCKKWLENAGAVGVYIDEALNVIFPLNCENSNEITVFAAHTDTVFPDTEPMPYFDDGEKIHSPGVADDTASVVVLLKTAEFFIKNNLSPEKGIMFVFNSCEEGLGNLKGVKQLFLDYSGRISTFITLDNQLNNVSNHSVGSHRYQVTVETEGGHSFGAFGNNNAIAKLSEIIAEIYKISVPEKKGTKTTYNVGTVSGGTSVNTIAQSAQMLCEYRSDDLECLKIMEEKFNELFSRFNTQKVAVKVNRVGDRPCSNTERAKIETLENRVVPIIESVINEEVEFKSMSTDCNVPLSLGVPSICIGACRYANMHTREEWLQKDSLKSGLEIVIKTAKELSF